MNFDVVEKVMDADKNRRDGNAGIVKTTARRNTPDEEKDDEVYDSLVKVIILESLNAAVIPDHQEVLK